MGLLSVKQLEDGVVAHLTGGDLNLIRVMLNAKVQEAIAGARQCTAFQLVPGNVHFDTLQMCADLNKRLELNEWEAHSILALIYDGRFRFRIPDATEKAREEAWVMIEADRVAVGETVGV